jgi:hypothetical protein
MTANYFTHGRTIIEDFRWIKTICFPSYGKWMNTYNDAVFPLITDVIKYHAVFDVSIGIVPNN